jgi:two-component system response regulator NreC
VIGALERREQRHVAVAVLDANPILGEAMCRHFSASRIFGLDEVTSLTWDQAERLQGMQPSILVLDPQHPPGGLDKRVAEFRAAVPGVRLVAYVSDPSVELARACLGLGFRAFIPRSADSSQLTTAVMAVAKGAMYVDRQFAEALLPAPSQPPSVPTAVTLSGREEAILRRIAQGYSHKQIATELGLSHKTVDTYRARGMRKLELSDRGALIRYALQQGWLK